MDNLKFSNSSTTCLKNRAVEKKQYKDVKKISKKDKKNIKKIWWVLKKVVTLHCKIKRNNNKLKSGGNA